MTAQTADRKAAHKKAEFFHYDVAASTKIYAGSLVVLDASGNAKPGSTATGLIAAGVAQAQVDNSTGAAGDKKVPVRAGIAFPFVNGETITKAHIGDLAYIIDDQTVGRTASGKSPAGPIVDVDAEGVWVLIMPAITPAITGLVAANNLSDLGSASTARSNLGLTNDTVVLNTRHKNVAGGAAYTVGSAADGDATIMTATDNAVITLPDAAAGNLGKRVTVINTAANGAALVSVAPHSSDGIFGTVAAVSSSGVVNKPFNNTKATAKKGDYIVLESDGSTGWYIVGGVGVWASTP